MQSDLTVVRQTRDALLAEYHRVELAYETELDQLLAKLNTTDRTVVVLNKTLGIHPLNQRPFRCLCSGFAAPASTRHHCFPCLPSCFSVTLPLLIATRAVLSRHVGFDAPAATSRCHSYDVSMFALLYHPSLAARNVSIADLYARSRSGADSLREHIDAIREEVDGNGDALRRSLSSVLAAVVDSANFTVKQCEGTADDMETALEELESAEFTAIHQRQLKGRQR